MNNELSPSKVSQLPDRQALILTGDFIAAQSSERLLAIGEAIRILVGAEVTIQIAESRESGTITDQLVKDYASDEGERSSDGYDDSAPQAADLSLMTPAEFILDYTSQRAINDTALSANPESTQYQEQAHESSRRILSLTRGLKPLAKTDPERALAMFDTLRKHGNLELQELAFTLICPLLSQELKSDNPRPERVIAGWAELLGERDWSDPNLNDPPMWDMIRDFFRDDKFTKRLTLFQMRDVLGELF